MRRRTTTTPAPKTVLKSNQIKRNQIDSYIHDNTQSKDTSKTSEKETLTGNKFSLGDDDDGDNEFNVIALPTESVTENVPFPENIFTTRTPITTQSPTTTPSIQVTETFIQSESLNDVIDDGSNEIDPETTTLVNDLHIIESGLSKQNDVLNFVEKSNSIAPRPFSRPSLSRTRGPTLNRRNQNENENLDNQEPPRSVARRRPTQTRTTSAPDNEVESTSRAQYSYRPGYRGSARFRTSTTRSGQYSKEDLTAGNFQPLETNRLRALNQDRISQREYTVPVSVVADTTKRRLTTTRTRFAFTSPSPVEDEEEQTTEQRIVEAKNRFNLAEGERPERIRFELAVGRKIDFGFKPTKSRDKASESDSSKVKVITGPLEKSPLVSGRDHKKGHVEEIPLTNSENAEAVTVQSFSHKLNLNEIPLNKSDIESFVADGDLRTESPADETTTKKLRLKPSKTGFLKRPQSEESDDETTTEALTEDSTTSRTRLRPSKIGFAQRTQPNFELSGEDTTTDAPVLEESTSRFHLRPGQTRFPPRTKPEIESTASADSTTKRSRLFIQDRLRGKSESNDKAESTTGRVRPSGFQNRLITRSRPIRTRTKSADDSKTEESTTSRVRVRPSQNRFALKPTIDDLNIEDVNDLQTEIPFDETTIVKSRLRPSQSNKFAVRPSNTESSNDDLESLNLVTEKAYEDDENENEIDFTTPSNFDDLDEDETTFDTLIETTSTTLRSPIIRKRPVKKIDVLATRQTITEASEEETSENDEVVKVSTESLIRTRPTRKLLTRLRGNDNQSPFIASSTRTTRKRVVYTRPRARTTEEEEEIADDDNQVSETTERLTFSDNVEESSEKPNEGAIRKRIKVYRTRQSSEKPVEAEEETSARSPLLRKRVFKRPLPVPEEKPEEKPDDYEADEETLLSRLANGKRRKVVKINRKLVPSENDESATVEPENESSTSAPKRSYKVLRTKTPKLLVDRPLIEETSLIKPDEEAQELDNRNEYNDEEENDEDEESVDVVSEEPSRPILKFPTRPNSGNRVVTIKRRPAFNQNSRGTTIHPASTRFSKDTLPTRARQVTIRRKFKPSIANGGAAADEIDADKKVALGERNKKIFSKGYRKSLSSTLAPNITPHDTETTEYDDAVDTTEIPHDSNDEIILQKEVTPTKPRFSLSRFTTTTIKPTTLHHVFAIDVEEEQEISKNKKENKENNADEVIKKLQKLIEINRIVEVYSKEEKLKLLKNKKLKSIKTSEWTVEKPPALENFGVISRETIIKLVKSNSTTSTERPVYSHTREAKNVPLSETMFGHLESSTISLEGLFEREKKSQKDSAEDLLTSNTKVNALARASIPLLRPESNETNPIIISLKSLDKVILSKVQRLESEREENLTTENPFEDETTSIDDN